jgi:methionyl-tRNA formyltransferase
MTDQNQAQPLKFVVFAASIVVIPVLNQLLQQQQLAGVILNSKVNNDLYQLEQQLHQANIPYIRYDPAQLEPVAQQLEAWQTDISLLYTFSNILPASILNKAKLGTYNIHASSLPKYRGAMPLYWQIRNGETDSQLSLIKAELVADSGDIVMQVPLPIHPLDTQQNLGASVATQAVLLIEQFIAALANDTLAPKPQTGDISYATRVNQQPPLINWQQMSAQDICCAARAGNPILNGIGMLWISAGQQSVIGLLQATAIDLPNHGVPPGTVLHVGEPEGVIVATKQGSLRLDVIVVAEGVYSGLAFANRFKLDAGVQFLSPDNLQ